MDHAGFRNREMWKTQFNLPIPDTLFQAMFMAKWAILGPTPGSFTSSSTVPGMSPPYFCFRMAVVCLMYFTLFWKTKGKSWKIKLPSNTGGRNKLKKKAITQCGLCVRPCTGVCREVTEISDFSLKAKCWKRISSNLLCTLQALQQTILLWIQIIKTSIKIQPLTWLQEKDHHRAWNKGWTQREVSDAELIHTHLLPLALAFCTGPGHEMQPAKAKPPTLCPSPRLLSSPRHRTLHRNKGGGGGYCTQTSIPHLPSRIQQDKWFAQVLHHPSAKCCQPWGHAASGAAWQLMSPGPWSGWRASETAELGSA